MPERRSRISELRARVAIAALATFALALGAVDLWGARGQAKSATAPAAAPVGDSAVSAPAPLTTRSS